jgi:hypothetical protein
MVGKVNIVDTEGNILGFYGGARGLVDGAMAERCR